MNPLDKEFIEELTWKSERTQLDSGDKGKVQNWEVDLWQRVWVAGKPFYISVWESCSTWFQWVVKCDVVEEGCGPLEKDNLCQRRGQKVSESPWWEATGLTAQTWGRTRLERAAKPTLSIFPYWELANPTEGPRQLLLQNLKKYKDVRGLKSHIVKWHVGRYREVSLMVIFGVFSKKGRWLSISETRIYH